MHRIIRKRIPVLKSSDLSYRRLAYMEFDSGKRGPVLWLTACIHGDEVGGIAIIHEILAYLKKNPLKRGKLCTFPLMNPMAFEMRTRNLPITNEDLNRLFPGNENGSIGERTTYKIFSMIVASQPTLVLDLHNDWTNSIPYALLDTGKIEQLSAYRETLEIAKELGLPLVRDVSPTGMALADKTLSGSLMYQHIPAVTLEFGASNVVREKDVSQALRVILKVLKKLDMINAKEPFSGDEASAGLHGVLDYYDRPFFADTGLVRYLVKPGQIVEANQPMAKLYNVFGNLTETLRARKKSLVLGFSDSSVGIPSTAVVALGEMTDDAGT